EPLLYLFLRLNHYKNYVHQQHLYLKQSVIPLHLIFLIELFPSKQSNSLYINFDIFIESLAQIVFVSLHYERYFDNAINKRMNCSILYNIALPFFTQFNNMLYISYLCTQQKLLNFISN